MPAAAVIVPAAIAAGTAIYNGIKGRSAAKKAAELQTEAAKNAGDLVVETANNVNPGITQTAATAGANARIAAGNAGAGVTNAADRANGLLDPYAGAGADATGTLRNLLVPGGELNRNFTGDDFKSLDPGFDFRLQQNQLALARSAAAKGGALGGGAAKDLSKFSQDYASSEFANAFQRFRENSNDRYSRLMGVSKVGYDAANKQGGNLFDAAKYSGDIDYSAAQFEGTGNIHAADLTASNSLEAARARGEYLTQGANAGAGGLVNAAAAGAAATNGAASAAQNAGNLLALRDLLKNPAAKGTGPAYQPAKGTGPAYQPPYGGG
jgi:hypothetical protein